MEYRHEVKFEVSEIDLEKIRYRLSPFMRYDEHQQGEYYTVRSLYFDDIYDSCLDDNENGIEDRKKYRIRAYGKAPEAFYLEKKSKLGDRTRKVAEEITKDMCREYMKGNPVEGTGEISLELACLVQRRNMAPKCIVEYDRTAFVEDVGNVRITFDRNIRGSMDPERFLEHPSDYLIPAMAKGRHVLEVKYDEFLPAYLLQVLDTNTLLPEALSKYTLVRNKFYKRKEIGG